MDCGVNVYTSACTGMYTFSCVLGVPRCYAEACIQACTRALLYLLHWDFMLFPFSSHWNRTGSLCVSPAAHIGLIHQDNVRAHLIIFMT